MLHVTTGPVQRPQKVVVYGPEGIGKSTLASQAPDPIYIDTEQGSAHLDIRRIDGVTDWDTLLATVAEVAATPGFCRTLVVDTADWAEQMLIKYICNKHHKTSLEDFGYGKGYTYLAEEFSRLLQALDQVITAGMHVIMLAHAKMRKMELPEEAGAYDRWELKLSRQVSPLLKEWCDALLFCTYQTLVTTDDRGKSRARGNRRVIYCNHNAVWDAKNRHNLPDVIDLDYRNIAPIFAGPSTPAATPAPTPAPAPVPAPDDYPDHPTSLQLIRQLMQAEGISEAQLCEFVTSKGKQPPYMQLDDYPESFLTGWIIKYWDKIVDSINNNQ